MRTAGHAELAFSRLAQQVHAVLAGLAAPQAPGRALATAHQLEIPFAFDQVCLPYVDAEPAAILAGAAGIRAQGAPFDQHRAFELDAFDRPVAHVALTHRDRAGLAVLIRPATPAAALEALHHEAPVGLRMGAKEHDRAAQKPVVAGRHPVGHGGRERPHDAVHHHRNDHAPGRHRRGKARHHDVAFGDDHLQRPERPFIDGIERAGQRFVSDAGARQRARVDGGAPLFGAAGEIDRHRAFVDRDLGMDRHRLAAADAVLVERRARLVGAVGELRHHVAALGFGLVEDLRNGGEDGVAAVFVEQLVHATGRQSAGRHLRFHVAERGLGKADVVLEHAIQRLVDLARLVDLELVELQPFHPRIGDGGPGAEAGAHAAHVDPVCAHHREHQELALIEVGHVDDDVVEVLPRHRLVIGDDHVAGGETILAVALEAVGDDDAEIGHEMRHAAHVLADQLAVGVDERGTEIAHFVNHHVVGGALQVGRHLVGDRRQGVADDFERDGIEGHAAPPTSMISSPEGATSHESFSNSTVVVPCSWISAGPGIRSPARSASR